MCRVLAWHGGGKKLKVAEAKKVNKLIKGLLLAEAGSNPDGTGLLTVKARKEGEKVYLLKRGINALKFLVQEEERINWMLDNAKIVIGHVRYATKGEISDGNSHPFMFRVKGKIFAGVHNGVINYEDLVKKALSLNIKNPKWYEVDSFLLFACIAKLLRQDKAVEEVVEEVLKNVSGSWALIIYWDRKIYFVRSVDRPLWVCDLREKGLGRFIVSTEEMFEKACKIAGEEFKEMPHFEPLPYRFYVIDSEGEVKKVKDLKLREPVYRDYYMPYIWNGYCEWDGYEDEYYELKEELEYVEEEIRDIKEYLNIMESEFSDDPEHVYAVEEAEERLKELYRKRRKLKQALKDFKNEFIPAGDMRAGAYSYMQSVQM